jgi:GLPGLI family protein
MIFLFNYNKTQMLLARYMVSLLSAFLIFGSCFGQESNQVLATYDFINKNENKFQIMKLWINRSHAYSEFFNVKLSRDTLYSDDFEDIHFKKENNDSIGQQYYLTNDKIIFRDHIYTNNQFTPVIVHEKIPLYNWKLTTDTISLSGYLCNNATLEFRGRNYIVWYTTEIPTQFGPWKFYGLPGLIINIETDDNSLSFRLSKLELITGEKSKAPAMAKEITFAEYVNYQEKIADDFVEKIKTKLPRGSTIKVNKTESTSIEKNYD